VNNNTGTNWTQADHTIIAESHKQNAPSAEIVQRLEAKLDGKRFKSSTASPDGSTRQSDRTDVGASLRRRTNCTQGGWFYIPPERRAELIAKDDAKQKLSPSRLDATDAQWNVLKIEKTTLWSWDGSYKASMGLLPTFDLQGKHVGGAPLYRAPSKPKDRWEKVETPTFHREDDRGGFTLLTWKVRDGYPVDESRSTPYPTSASAPEPGLARLNGPSTDSALRGSISTYRSAGWIKLQAAKEYLVQHYSGEWSRSGEWRYCPTTLWKGNHRTAKLRVGNSDVLAWTLLNTLQQSDVKPCRDTRDRAKQIAFENNAAIVADDQHPPCVNLHESGATETWWDACVKECRDQSRAGFTYNVWKSNQAKPGPLRVAADLAVDRTLFAAMGYQQRANPWEVRAFRYQQFFPWLHERANKEWHRLSFKARNASSAPLRTTGRTTLTLFVPTESSLLGEEVFTWEKLHTQVFSSHKLYTPNPDLWTGSTAVETQQQMFTRWLYAICTRPDAWVHRREKLGRPAKCYTVAKLDERVQLTMNDGNHWLWSKEDISPYEHTGTPRSTKASRFLAALIKKGRDALKRPFYLREKNAWIARFKASGPQLTLSENGLIRDNEHRVNGLSAQERGEKLDWTEARTHCNYAVRDLQRRLHVAELHGDEQAVNRYAKAANEWMRIEHICDIAGGTVSWNFEPDKYTKSDALGRSLVQYEEWLSAQQGNDAWDNSDVNFVWNGEEWEDTEEQVAKSHSSEYLEEGEVFVPQENQVSQSGVALLAAAETEIEGQKK
jgi:hypothetical protein